MRIFLIVAILFVLGAAGFYIYTAGALNAGGRSTQESPNAEESGTASQAAQSDIEAKAQDGPLWSKRCSQSEDQKPQQCEVYQMLSVAKTKQRFMEAAFTYTKTGGGVAAAIILPLGITVSEGGVLQVDEDPNGKKFVISTCVPAGCIAQFKLDDAFVKKLEAGKTLMVGMVQRDGKPLRVRLPLDGFAEAMRSLKD